MIEYTSSSITINGRTWPALVQEQADDEHSGVTALLMFENGWTVALGWTGPDDPEWGENFGDKVCAWVWNQRLGGPPITWEMEPDDNKEAATISVDNIPKTLDFVATLESDCLTAYMFRNGKMAKVMEVTAK